MLFNFGSICYAAKRMKKHLTLTALCISSLVFVGCSQPQPTETNLDGYEILNEQTGDTSFTDDAQTLNSDAIDTQALNTQQGSTTTQQLQERGSMSVKTLADFETVEATQVTLTTNKGDITFEIYTDKVPLTAQNFLNLAQEGFYDGMVFHRVIDDFMIQVGDPLSKDPSQEARWGTGGPGYTIADEFDPSLKHDGPGVVSMANAGPNTGGSQIFITHVATPWLDGKHAVFGKVIEGMDVVNAIERGDTITAVTYQ